MKNHQKDENIKELTWEHHKEAERQKFVKVLMSVKINPEIYAIYLYNQHQCYNMLEALAMSEGIFDDMPELRRAPAIKQTLTNCGLINQPVKMESTGEYLKYISKNLMDNPEKISSYICKTYGRFVWWSNDTKKNTQNKENIINLILDMLKEEIRNIKICKN